jgi:hypothetical protein
VNSGAWRGVGGRDRISCVGGSVALFTINFILQGFEDVENVQCQSRKCIHNQVQPEQLNRLEDTLIITVVNSGDDREQDGGNIDGDLELFILASISPGYPSDS